MNALEAHQRIDDCKALSKELNRLSQYVGSNDEILNAASKACAVYSITARLQYAARMLTEYADLATRELRNHEVFYFDR